MKGCNFSGQSGAGLILILVSILSILAVSLYSTIAQGDVCGDGLIGSLETCDDGDAASGDGCDSTCHVETGWSCTGQPSICTTINPTLSGSCGIDMLLVIDSSGSISSSELTQMKTAYKQFVDAFLPNTPTEIALVEFDTQASLTRDYTNNSTLVKNAIDSAASGGTTNWQDALLIAKQQFDNRADKPDLFVFASDGNPNRIGNPAVIANESAAVAAAVVVANQIKLSGIRVITLGIGNDLDSDNMIAISSPDALYTSNFDTLAQTLAQIAEDLCGGTITVKKLIDGTPAGGWNFSAAATGGTPSPPYGLTDSGGFIVFDINITGISSSVNITEIPKPGHALLGAKCHYSNQSPAGTLQGLTMKDILLKRSDSIFCEFNNTARECETNDDCNRLDDVCAEGVCNASYNCAQAYKPDTTLCRPAAGTCDNAEYCTGSGPSCPQDVFKPLSTPCEADGQFCTVDHCNGAGTCVYWKAYDCSANNIAQIATCFNNPDNNGKTFDWRNPFTSACNESSDSCTTGSSTVTHACADADASDGVFNYGGVRTCQAECDGAGVECQSGCTGNIFHSNGTCTAGCTCNFAQSENCDLKDGWYDNNCSTCWKYYDCKKCKDKEYRDYYCSSQGCAYTVTNTSLVCENMNEGQLCGIDPYSCKDFCTRSQLKYTCQAGLCSPDGWANTTSCSPNSCSGGVCDGCSQICGAQCDENSDCSASTCSKYYNDTCSGLNLKEYDSDKIKDSTLVSNSVPNTCSGSCSCTSNPATCPAPPTNEYCVQGVCGAQCDSNDDCDDGNPSTTDTCLGDCTCYHEYTPFCGNGQIDPPQETCELPSTGNNNYCPQSNSECSGRLYGARDYYGNCKADCTCQQDPFTYSCVKGQCGAECSANADCDDQNPTTIDTCLGDCTCSHTCEPVCQRDGQYGQGHEFICKDDGTYDRCSSGGCSYEHSNICREECTASPQCDGYAPGAGLFSCTIYGQPYLQDYCDAQCHIRDDNCEDDYSGCTGDAECDELVPGTGLCSYQCDYKPLLCYRDGMWGEGHEFKCREDNTYERCNEQGTGYIHINICKYYCSASVECDGYAPETDLPFCDMHGQDYLQDYCDASCMIQDDNCESNYEGCTSDPECDEAVPGASQECDTQCVYHYCGDDFVDPWEECELPNTFNNAFCPQTTTDCSGHKLGTRDNKGDCNGLCGCTDDPFSYSCVEGQCGAACDQSSDFNVVGQTCSYNCDTQQQCGYQSQCSLQKFCTAGEVRNYNGTCSGSGCSFQTEDCDGRDYYDAFVSYCSVNTIRKHRLFHDFSCSGGDCVENAYYVDDQQLEDCTVNLCSGEVRKYNGVCNPSTVTCQYTQENCNGLDGTYCKDSSTLEQRNYYCTPSQCAYNVTGIQSCGTDAWTGGGNTPGFGADPSCIYTDYFCTGSSPNAFCSSTIAQDKDFDNLDNPSACNGIMIGKHDFWCNLATCDPVTPSNGCSSGNTWYDLVCSQQCGAQCDQNSDCTSFCSAGNVLNSNGVCDLQSACTCSYQTKDCDDYDDDYLVDFHCDPAAGDIFNYFQDWGCSSGSGSAQCAFTGVNWKDGLKQDCNDTCTDTDGGINFTVKGTVVDNDLCTDAQTQCPFVSQTDFCVESVLMEYYCSGNQENVQAKDCNSYDCTTPVPYICNGIGTNVIRENGDDYGCSVGACAKSGTKTCNGPWTCDQAHLCQQQPCGGQQPRCFYSGGYQWGSSPASESACSDGYDNDCDGKIDCADPDCAGQLGPGGVTCCQSKPDCNKFDLPSIGTCDYNPDNYHPTWDATPAVPSQCVSNACTVPQYGAITHTCNDNDLADGIAFGSGCGAQCDQNADCAPFLEDSTCHYGMVCQSLCTCSPGQQEFCPVPGTLIDSTCYYGERLCTNDGCSIQSCTLKQNQICDPVEGCLDIPCNAIPPITIFSDGSPQKFLDYQAGGGSNLSAKVIIPASFNATGARVNLTGIPLAFTGEKKVDIVVINDISGSMDDNCGPDGIAQPGETPCKINDMKNATLQFMNAMLIPVDNKMGLSSYNTKSINSIALTRNTATLTTEVNSYLANGRTCISCGIVNGTNTVRTGANPVKALLLMTDGEANNCLPGVTCTPIIAKQEAIQKASEAWSLYGIKIYAVAFGAEADNVTMKQIADVSHGKFYIANDTNIINVYNEIAIEITKSDITSPYLDVGANGIKEWTHSGVFNTTEMASGWHPEINSLIESCSCPGCSLDGITGACTIEMKVFSNSSGRILLDNLSIEGCVYQSLDVACSACTDCGGGEDCKDTGAWSQPSCQYSDTCDESADCTKARQVTNYVCNNPGSVNSYCSSASGQEQEQTTENRDTDGQTCDDGLYCTVADSCASGSCSGQARPCDDHNECTDDSCDEGSDQCISTYDDSNTCGAFRDCPDSGCEGLNWVTYQGDGNDICQAGLCMVWSCEPINSEPSEQCGFTDDQDDDGTPDSQDACLLVPGSDCNGCPDPCSGCAQMACSQGTLNPPTCVADDSQCLPTTCPADGCGLGECPQSQMADYPDSVPNTCSLSVNAGTCTVNQCFETCIGSELCQQQGCEPEITVSTDSGAYCPEDMVTIYGHLWDVQCNPVPNADVAIQVSNSTESLIYVAQVSTNESGAYTSIFMLPADTQGSYTVFAAQDGLTSSVTFAVNECCEDDQDGDGTPDSQDACPDVYGKACNGCPNPCSGCAQMACGSGAPTCAPDNSQCSPTICPADGCGLDGCSATQMADYPDSVPNTCSLSVNAGTCTANQCTATCASSEQCLPHANHVVFSEVMYDPSGSDTDREWIELYNPTGSGVDLSGMKINDTSGSWTIPQGVMMMPGSYLTIADNATEFFKMYGCYPTVEGFTRPLENTGGDALWLKNGTQIIDMVAWRNKVPGWSIESSENKTISRSPVWLDTDTAADWQNNTSPTPNPCLKIVQFSTYLKKGWNLISIPVDLEDKTIGNVLSSIAGKYNMVRSFSPPSTWKTYDPAHPGISDLNMIYPDSGYWINITEGANLTVTGREMANTQILVAPGWNLIGYPSFTTRGVSSGLSSVAGNYVLVRTFDPDEGWKTYDPAHPEFSDLLNLSPGLGYWINMKVPDTVII
jgi:Mg-chelatase subunit ChlD